MNADEIDAQVAVLEEMIEWLRGLKRVAVAPPVSPAQPVDDLETLTDLIHAGDAAALTRRAKSTVAAWCRSNAIDGERGFAVRIGSRWFVSKGRLLQHLASVSRD